MNRKKARAGHKHGVPSAGIARGFKGFRNTRPGQQPSYGPPIDTRPLYNAIMKTGLELGTQTDPPVELFERMKNLLRLRRKAGRVSKQELLHRIGRMDQMVLA